MSQNRHFLSTKLIARDISTVRMSQGNKPRAVITTCTHFAIFLSFQMFMASSLTAENYLSWKINPLVQINAEVRSRH